MNSIPFTATPPLHLAADSDTSIIVTFNSNISKSKVLLNWTVDENEATNRFELERSADGKVFKMAAMIFGTDKAGKDNYQFFEKLNKSRMYYRVKAVAKDGSIGYSKIIAVMPAH